MPTKITVTIEDELGDLSVAANGWKKQLTYTSWNGRDPKFDLRSWSVDHKSMTKGLTLTKEEMIKLKEILTNIDLQLQAKGSLGEPFGIYGNF